MPRERDDAVQCNNTHWLNKLSKVHILKQGLIK
jgi:hypothetical protein